MGGHSSTPVTYNRIGQLFYWQGMKADVWAYVQSYTTCLQAKPERVCYPGLLQSLPVPSQSWEVGNHGFHRGLAGFWSCE